MNRRDDVAAKPLCGANWPTPCADCVGSCGIEEYEAESAASTLRGPHTVGKPCPAKPYMLVTTLDWQKNRCGACGRKLYATA